jgi:hypothetical protein
MTEGDSQQIDALLKATLGKYSGACGLLLFPHMRRVDAFTLSRRPGQAGQDVREDSRKRAQCVHDLL